MTAPFQPDESPEKIPCPQGRSTYDARQWGLIRSSGAVLLDIVPNPKLMDLIRDRLEIAGDRVADLHLWRVGPGHTAVIAAVVSDQPKQPAVYKARLNGLAGISHVTVEVHSRPDHAPPTPAA